MVSVDIIGIIGQIVVWSMVILSIIVVALGAYFGFRWIDKTLKYKYRIYIFEQVGGSERLIVDRAREISKDSKDYLSCLKTKNAKGKFVQIPIPDPRKLVPGGINKYLFLSKVGDLYTPMEVVRNKDAGFKFDYEDLVTVIRWREQDHQEALDKYRDDESFWERNQTILAVGAFMMVFVVFAFIMIWQLQGLEIKATIDATQIIR